MKDIRLADNTLIEVNINFLTIKLLTELNIDNLQKKAIKKPKDKSIQLDLVGKIIYAILRSNGKRVDEEEALALIPIDDSTILEIMKEFENKMEKFKKKQVNKGQIPMK